MSLTEFIILFEFNLVAEDTDENNIIRLFDYDNEIDFIGCIERFEDYQSFYIEYGSYEIVEIMPSAEPHVIELMIRKVRSDG